MLDQLEGLEQTVMEMVLQALTDYRVHADTIFREETDLPQDIAEDVTREALWKRWAFQVSVNGSMGRLTTRRRSTSSYRIPNQWL